MIIITTQCFFPKIGGIESLMTGMAESFSINGEKIIVLADGKKTQEDNKFSFKIIRFNSWKPIRKIQKSLFINKLLQKNEVKAIYADSWKSIEHLNTDNKCKIIVLAHGTEIPKENSRRKLKNKRVRNSYRKSNVIIANSNYTKDLMSASLNIEPIKIKIIHPGIDVYKEHITLKDKNKIDTLSRGFSPILITLARVEKRKGHEFVIKAISKIIDDLPNILYLIAGKGPYLKNLQKLVTQLDLKNNIKFIGWITEPEKSVILDKSDIFIMTPTIYKESVEGFGMAFLDASFHSIPVIGSRSGGINDAIKENYSGLLCEPENVEDIADKIKLLSNNIKLRQKYGEQGRKMVIDTFVWEKKYKEYLSFI